MHVGQRDYYIITDCCCGVCVCVNAYPTCTRSMHSALIKCNWFCTMRMRFHFITSEYGHIKHIGTIRSNKVCVRSHTAHYYCFSSTSAQLFNWNLVWVVAKHCIYFVFCWRRWPQKPHKSQCMGILIGHLMWANFVCVYARCRSQVVLVRCEWDRMHALGRQRAGW